MAMGISGLMADKNLRPITDPNPVEVIEDLKSLPDNILAEYAQDRTNPNATYALTVLMSRKRAKDALVKEDMPKTTVAEDVYCRCVWCSSNSARLWWSKYVCT
jgi:hypothetical protein